MKMGEEIGTVMRDIYGAPSKEEARARLEKAVDEYAQKAPKFSHWLEEKGEEGFMFYDYSKEHWKRIRTSNVSERLNQEIKRRTRVARLFPNAESCLKVATAGVVEIGVGKWEKISPSIKIQA